MVWIQQRQDLLKDDGRGRHALAAKADAQGGARRDLPQPLLGSQHHLRCEGGRVGGGGRHKEAAAGEEGGPRGRGARSTPAAITQPTRPRQQNETSLTEHNLADGTRFSSAHTPPPPPANLRIGLGARVLEVCVRGAPREAAPAHQAEVQAPVEDVEGV